MRYGLGDDMVVLLLLQNNASPSMREEGSNDPIFVAIDIELRRKRPSAASIFSKSQV